MQNFDRPLWQQLGSHPCSKNGQDGYRFRIWEPNARQVCLMGDFNGWNATTLPMTRTADDIWELFVPGIKRYTSYKYAIHTHDNRVLEKADPYAFHTEAQPGTASKCYDLSGYSWGDKSWMAWRSKHPAQDNPLNIYEAHLGSWRRTGDGAFLTYREIAQQLVPYAKKMGFTHVELLPVTEHPADDSWGYQCTSYFAVANCFGIPHDFMYLVDELHKAGIGIILDWVYNRLSDESLRDDEFLISSALFWLEEYHIDGLRPVNPHNSHEVVQAAAFLRRLNETVLTTHPDVLMIGSSAYNEELGFSLTWDTDWTHDLCHYAKLDPYFRQFNHKDITASLMSSALKHSILPISHDEIVHGKCSLLNKMPGIAPDKYAGVRVFYTYMLTHPGKKLLMMGSEFGQWNEWHSERSLDWHLLEQQDEDGKRHRQLLAFFQAANTLYLETPALWQQDFSREGFRWICSDDAHANTILFLRFDKKGRVLLAALNFSPVFRSQYRIGVPWPGRYEEVFNTDLVEFGGENRLNIPKRSEYIPCHGMEQSLQVDLPPLGAVIFKCSKNFQQKTK